MNKINVKELFEKERIAVKVGSSWKLSMLKDIVGGYLFKDTSLINMELKKGTYSDLFKNYIPVRMGMVNGQVQVLEERYFIEHGYELIGYDEFIESIRRG